LFAFDVLDVMKTEMSASSLSLYCSIFYSTSVLVGITVSPVFSCHFYMSFCVILHEI